MNSPLAHIDPSAKIGKNTKIHPFAFIDANVEIGDDCEILPYASIMSGTRMGNGNRVFQGSVVGAEPQDFRWTGEETFCYIGNGNIIRENVIINRGIKPDSGTKIGDNTFIFAKSHIGHDCQIDNNCVIGNGVTFGGNVTVDNNTILSSNCILHEGSKIGKWAMVKGGCRISGNVPPYIIVAHNPVNYYGVNAYVMKRQGFTDADVDEIAKAYRHIYQSGSSVFNALKRVENDVQPSEYRDEILKFIRDNKLSIVATQIDLE